MFLFKKLRQFLLTWIKTKLFYHCFDSNHTKVPVCRQKVISVCVLLRVRCYLNVRITRFLCVLHYLSHKVAVLKASLVDSLFCCDCRYIYLNISPCDLCLLVWSSTSSPSSTWAWLVLASSVDVSRKASWPQLHLQPSGWLVAVRSVLPTSHSITPLLFFRLLQQNYLLSFLLLSLCHYSLL